MIVGGSAGSTSGGIKVLRVGILGKELVAYVKDLLACAFNARGALVPFVVAEGIVFLGATIAYVVYKLVISPL